MAQGRSSSTSFTQQLKKVRENLDEVVPIFMSKMATEIIRLSPVLSGEYVKSHNINVNVKGIGGRFAGRFTKNPASLNPEADKQEGLSKLMSQIAAMPKDTPVVAISNSVPHAYKVEYAGWGPTPPYLVYQTAKVKANQFLQEAKVEAGLS